MTRMICGVDVAAQTLQARIGAQGAQQSFANHAEGIAELAAFCRQHQVELVVMEATGGYEQMAYALLWEQGLEVAIVNPLAVRRFAQSMGHLEKTDALDAGVIAHYAATKNVQPQPPASATQQKLRALVTHLRQLTVTRVQLRQQQRLVGEPMVLASFQRMLDCLEQEEERLEEAIAELISADPLWQKLNESFRQIKGVASRTVARLMAEMPEMGTVSNKAIAKLAGLAPLANDSGRMQGRRAVRGGRRHVREVLYVVAGIVCRFDAHFQAFAQRLLEAGKPKKVVRIAVARKLLVRLNARAREVRAAFACA